MGTAAASPLARPPLTDSATLTLCAMAHPSPTTALIHHLSPVGAQVRRARRKRWCRHRRCAPGTLRIGDRLSSSESDAASGQQVYLQLRSFTADGDGCYVYRHEATRPAAKIHHPSTFEDNAPPLPLLGLQDCCKAPV
ncbi:hypothetical protein HYPSUDRAFT_210075 [Hypholoma sublateritium FD-334 SS-4]|uniref:Uncharacterized protein n=1 Tax=Hypholoma sublateritium (strain FD-334 SS-4) TaxID=945553 RepID=A0A0D2N0W0_HYPSF|nr:hypothetical protein HYPSUDRAFT_210075 [Hypholoma sublateritium FD-334 SS-4]